MKDAGSRIRDQRVVIHGAGTAGVGIADMMREAMIRDGLTEEEATRRFWAVDSRGLLTDNYPIAYGTSNSPTAVQRPRLPPGHDTAADAVASLADATSLGAALLPAVTDLRTVSAAVAIAVAQAADEHGLAERPLIDPVRQIHQAMWRPEYPPFEPI